MSFQAYRVQATLLMANTPGRSRRNALRPGQLSGDAPNSKLKHAPVLLFLEVLYLLVLLIERRMCGEYVCGMELKGQGMFPVKPEMREITTRIRNRYRV